MLKFGNISKNQSFVLSFNGLSFSPMPVASAVPDPERKKGTSAPSDLESCCKYLSVRFSSNSLFSPFSVVAALLLPPPRPDPAGIFFLYVWTHL